jgi:hypothetical protein
VSNQCVQSLSHLGGHTMFRKRMPSYKYYVQYYSLLVFGGERPAGFHVERRSFGLERPLDRWVAFWSMLIGLPMGGRVVIRIESMSCTSKSRFTETDA